MKNNRLTPKAPTPPTLPTAAAAAAVGTPTAAADVAAGTPTVQWRGDAVRANLGTPGYSDSAPAKRKKEGK